MKTLALFCYPLAPVAAGAALAVACGVWSGLA